MKSITKVPYLYFWILLPAFCLVMIFFGNQNFDLQMHDTYFIVRQFDIWIRISSSFAVIGLIYWALRNYKLVNWMTRLHVISSLMFVFYIANLGDYQYHLIDNEYRLLPLIVVIALVAQALFVLNVLASTILKHR